MATYSYVRDGQHREITGTEEEIEAEKAGIPFQPVAPSGDIPPDDIPPDEDTAEEPVTEEE